MAAERPSLGRHHVSPPGHKEAAQVVLKGAETRRNGGRAAGGRSRPAAVTDAELLTAVRQVCGLLVDDGLRARLDEQRRRLSYALAGGDEEQIATQTMGMRRGWLALDRAAADAGAEPLAPEVWEAQLSDGTVVGVVRSEVEAQHVCRGHTDFVRQYPVATKRAMRAILKATDLCATEPEGAARQLVKDGFAHHYDTALQTITDVPYNVWRELDPEDSLRFYGLWLHEFGIVNSTPNQIIAEGTDWRFLNELKRELKA